MPDRISDNTGRAEKTAFQKELETLDVHDHACFLYRSQPEWQSFVSSYIEIGLRRGEKCCYIYDAHNAQEVRNALKAEGVDNRLAEDNGQLSIIHGHKVYMKQGSFDPDRVIAFLVSETEKALNAGYTALRVAGERDWLSQQMHGSEKILEYESRVNHEFFQQYPGLLVCQYNLSQFDPGFIKELIFTHPNLIRARHVFANFYYTSGATEIDQDGINSGLQFLFNNIEREDKRERTLRDMDHKFEVLFNQTQSVILVTDEKGRFIDANQAALRFLECDLPELRQKSIQDYTLTPVPEELLRQTTAVPASTTAAAGNIQTDFNVRGKTRTLLHSIFPVMVSHQQLLCCIGQDITRYIGHENAAPESAGQYRDLLDNLDIGMFRVKAEGGGRFLEVNSALSRLTGYSRTEMLELELNGLFLSSTEEPSLIERIIDGPSPFKIHVILLRKNRSQVEVTLSAAAVQDSQGIPVYIDGLLSLAR